jgi:energy-coupling factor transport system ATP-binding protein
MSLALKKLAVAAPDDRSRLLLLGLDLELRNGTVTLLIGRTGSGKSTLLQTLAGIRPPTAGEVMLDGQPLWRRGRVDSSLLLRLGLTFQFPEQQLFARSVQGEFDYSLRPFRLDAAERESRIKRATSAFDPNGTVFERGRSPFSLSGGEQRRLALATTHAVIRDGDWLLMDEPTAGLEAAATAELLEWIRSRRGDTKGGIVIATHDLDTFFPLADRVIVLHNGVITADSPPAALCLSPESLLQAGVGLPSCIVAAQAFAHVGLPLSADLLTPEAAAQAIEAVLLGERPARRSEDAGITDASGAIAEPDGVPKLEHPGLSGQSRQAKQLEQPDGHQLAVPPPVAVPVWYRLDPRAKWLFYVVFVIGTMLQQQLIGLLVAALPLAASFLGLPASVLRGGFRFARPFVLFALLSIALSGIDGFGGSGIIPLQFSQERAQLTALNMLRLLLVTFASFWLTAATPYGSMMQGLSTLLKPGRRLKLPVEAFTLAVSLIFRFIPIVITEWQRFSAVVRARGKAAVKPDTVRVRDVPALVVPLLLSLFHRAEAMTVGLELKKAGSRIPTVRSATLIWSRLDSIYTAGTLMLLLVLILIRHF